jgi:putative DNA primase/helicase
MSAETDLAILQAAMAATKAGDEACAYAELDAFMQRHGSLGAAAAPDPWVESARAVRIECELERRSIQLQGHGPERAGPCPVCGGTDRFSINTAKQVWNCRGCEAKGKGTIDLVKFLDGCNFLEAVETITGEPRPGAAPKKVVAERFDYHDETGTLLYQIERVEFRNPDGSFVLADGGKRKKTFRQRRPDPDHPDGWLWNLDGIALVPYRLPELLDSLGDNHPVIIAEGERKINLLWSWGFAATCNSGGSKKWQAEHSAFLRSANVVILPDNDPAGWKHLDAVAASLKEVGAEVRVLNLPGLGPKGDVVDWAARGGTAEQLHELLALKAKPWVPSDGHGTGEPGEAEAKPNDDAAMYGRGEPDGRPPGPLTIYIKAGQLGRLVDETEAAVIAADRGLYRRGGLIVRVGEIELLGADEKKTTALAILDQNEHALLEDVSASAQFLKYNKREDAWLPADPPMTVVKAWQARASRLRLPLLSGVISTPLILPIGRIIERPGYDESTGFYFDPLGTVFPPMPSTPTQDDARDALDLLKGLIEEFPFIDEASRAVALSGLLTSVARRALDFAFMHAVTAPAFGSGKSYLVDLFCVLATGRVVPVVTQGKTAEEFEKRLDAHLLKGVGHMAIDNVSRPLEGDRLCQILTQTFLDIRPLGTSGNTTVQPDAFVSATGTNITIVEDLRRRSLLCSMDAKEERPELRKFRADPLKAVREDRGKYVVAVLTIIRAFMLSGERQAEPINGYARYCAMIRDPLIWLGCDDPCATMETIREQDTTLGTKKQIARHWKVIFGNEPKTALQVVTEASKRGGYDELEHPEFYAVLSEVARDGKTLSVRRLGYWLRRAKGDVFSLLEDDPLKPGATKSTTHRFEASFVDRNDSTHWELKWP